MKRSQVTIALCAGTLFALAAALLFLYSAGNVFANPQREQTVMTLQEAYNLGFEPALKWDASAQLYQMISSDQSESKIPEAKRV